jgi:hypothetical protein
MPVATTVVSPSNIPRQLSTGDSQGEILGQSASDLIAFYGATPVAQRSGPPQFPVGTTLGGATLFSVNTTALTPTGVATITCAAQALTCTGSPTLAGDILIVNKIAAQAGLGIVNIRHGTTAATPVINYCNLSGGTLTPTATESYLILAVRAAPALITAGSLTITPAPVPANSTMEQIFTATGLVTAGSPIVAQKPTDQAGLGLAGARIVANNQVGITFINPTAATITPTAAEAYLLIAGGGYDLTANTFILGANVGTLTGVATITTAEQAITVTGGVAVGDSVLGISKPTQQNGLGIVNTRVSAANVLGVAFVNPTAGTLTPTASEIYQVQISRPIMPAVSVLYSVTLTPTSVAANTTAEQTFTVTGLLASTLVYVSKPSFTNGIGIVGYRVSAANTLAITFANPTAAAITPPSEVYLVANVSLMPSAGSYISQPVALGAVGTVTLANELRATMVGLGLIAGG